MPRGIPNRITEIDDMGIQRPPAILRPTSGAANTQTNYKPSVERNNLDQSLQPTGDGSVAGLPDLSPEEQAEEDMFADVRLFPVHLKRNYRPASDVWKVIKLDGTYGARPKFDEGQTPKVVAGFYIALPIDEAKGIINRGIADRADAIE